MTNRTFENPIQKVTLHLLHQEVTSDFVWRAELFPFSTEVRRRLHPHDDFTGVLWLFGIDVAASTLMQVHGDDPKTIADLLTAEVDKLAGKLADWVDRGRRTASG